MWRSPYQRAWGERLFVGLLSLLAFVVAVRILSTVLTPLLPALCTAVVVSGLVLYLLRRSYR